MEFKNISTEDDFREGQLRLEVMWDVKDVERFSDFFGRPMAEVVEQIAEPPREPASTNVAREAVMALVRAAGGVLTIDRDFLVGEVGEELSISVDYDHDTITLKIVPPKSEAPQLFGDPDADA